MGIFKRQEGLKKKVPRPSSMQIRHWKLMTIHWAIIENEIEERAKEYSTEVRKQHERQIENLFQKKDYRHNAYGTDLWH